MAKQISQETFDSVVRENMEEFDMPADEAMQEAVTQFEAQVNQLIYSTVFDVISALCALKS